MPEAASCEFNAGLSLWNCSIQDLTGINLTNALFASANVTNAEWEYTICPSMVNSDANGDTCCGEFLLGSDPSSGCPPV